MLSRDRPALLVCTLWKCEARPESDLCEAGGSILAVDCLAARQIERQEIEFGNLRRFLRR